jgi:hypothetical protein
VVEVVDVHALTEDKVDAWEKMESWDDVEVDEEVDDVDVDDEVRW